MRKIKRYAEYITEAKGTDILLELHNNFLPIINVGSYHQGLDIDNIFSEDMEALNNANIDIYKYFDNKKWDNVIIKEVQKIINDDFLPKFKEVVPEIKSIKAVDMYHPKSYNYGDDQINFDIVADAKLKERSIKVTEDPEFEKYLRASFKSSDGYINLMPSDIDEYLKDINGKDIERGYSAYFHFVLDKMMDGIKEIKSEYNKILHEELLSYAVVDFFSKVPKSEMKKMQDALNNN